MRQPGEQAVSGDKTLEPANAKDVKRATDELPAIDEIDGEKKGGGLVSMILVIAILGVTGVLGGVVKDKFFSAPPEEPKQNDNLDIPDVDQIQHSPAVAMKPDRSPKPQGTTDQPVSYMPPQRFDRSGNGSGVDLGDVFAANVDHLAIKDAPLATEPDDKEKKEVGQPNTDAEGDSEGMSGTRLSKAEEEEAAKLRRENTHLHDGMPEMPPGTDADSTEPMPTKRGMAGDLEFDREVFKPGVYPEAGRSRDYYLTLLRNHLHRQDNAVLDLQKAYILLSLYYDPSIDPDLYRGYFDGMVAELYDALTQPADASGRRELIPDPRQQVAIITEFMLHGYIPQVDENGLRTVRPTPYPGWRVQEYHSGIPGPGVAPQGQAMLVNEVFNPELMAMGSDNAGAARRQNVASNTALNLLTLIIVRRLQHQLPGLDSEKLGVKLPVYAVRLPDRTILRYNNMRGPGELIPDEETNKNDSYARNIEFLRNGNHCSGKDYVRRFMISDGERASGLYLQTLHDKHFFASLGFELAQAHVHHANSPEGAAQHDELFSQAQTLLETWVLDADNGMQGLRQVRRPDGSLREAPEVPMARGDPELRDAYLLYADMMLSNAHFADLQAQMEQSPSLRDALDDASELNGRQELDRGNLNAARAYFTKALEVADEAENARANYFLGEINFLLAKWSNQPRSGMAEEAKLSEAIRRYDMAIDADLLTSALSGDERRTLYFHRAIAHRDEGDLWKALGDMNKVAEMAPAFARTPIFETLVSRMKIDRAFEVLLKSEAKLPDPQAEGQAKFEAVAYLGTSLSLNAKHRGELLRCAEAFGNTGNIAAEWRLAGTLKAIAATAPIPAGDMAGAYEYMPDFGRDGAKWADWLRAYFAANP